jgi:predicted helicase
VGTLSGLLESLDADTGRRGKQFEHICKWFLTNDPVYRWELRRVWLWDEWPGRWGADAGIDLVAEEKGGRLWAIQAEVYDPSYSVTKADVNTFLSESARSLFTFRLLIATTDRIGRTAERTLQAQEKPASRLLLGDLRAAQVSWPLSPSDLRPAPKPRPKRPKRHQSQTITAVLRGFESADRGQMIMACGTGKTLTALFIAQRLAAKRTLVLVPSLSLLTDTLREWTANDEDFEFLPVCSDDTVTGTDAAVSSTADLGFPVTTDPQDIATFLRRRSVSKVVFATYQSSPRIAEAYRLGRVPIFDLVVADEAHRCAGRVSSEFATVLDADAIPARRRLFHDRHATLFHGSSGTGGQRGRLRGRLHGRRVPFRPRLPPTRVRRLFRPGVTDRLPGRGCGRGRCHLPGLGSARPLRHHRRHQGNRRTHPRWADRSRQGDAPVRLAQNNLLSFASEWSTPVR